MLIPPIVLDTADHQPATPEALQKNAAKVLSSSTHFLSQCSHSRGRILPSGSRKKLFQDERGCSHRHGILTKLAEIDPRQGEWLLESIALDKLVKLRENVLADLQTGPSTQEYELWVEKINEICDTHS